MSTTAARNLTTVTIDPAPAEGPGIVYLSLGNASCRWNIPVTLDDLREIRDVAAGTLPAWQGVKDAAAVVSALAGSTEGEKPDA